jgi:hypothetical protein
VAGRYFFHQKPRDPDPATLDIGRQDLLLELCRKVSGAALTASQQSDETFAAPITRCLH